MNYSAFNRRVLIEVPTETRDSYGALIPGFTTLATVWARVLPATGRELSALGTQLVNAGYSVRIRYRNDVTETARIQVDGRIMSVKSVVEVGRKDCIELLCEVVK